MRVPKEFQPPIKADYPPGNRIIFEQWLIDNIGDYSGEREYLPVNWCGYYVNNKHGNDPRAISRMQHFLNGLPNRKMWTVTQYDDGILNDISRFDIKVFCAGGGRIDFPIPLVCHPHGRQEHKRDIFCNFVGLLTHPIRREIIRTLPKGYYLSTDSHPIDKFCNVLSRSTFTLCPRGYGATSFRIAEALEQGSIPVYISDRFIKPFNKEMYDWAVLIEPEHIEDIDLILKSLSSEQIKSMQEAGKHYYQEYYTFEGCRKHIIENI